MKRIVRLIVILSLSASVCHAQKIATEEEYRVIYDSIVSLLRPVEKDVNDCIGKPFSELVKRLDKYGVKIIQSGATYREHERGTVEAKYFSGLRAYFTTENINDFARIHYLNKPVMYVRFNERKPYETYLELAMKYKGAFTEEVEAFYSDAIVKSIGLYHLDDMYQPSHPKGKRK
jgi:hypothetical protein